MTVFAYQKPSRSSKHTTFVFVPTTEYMQQHTIKLFQQRETPKSLQFFQFVPSKKFNTGRQRVLTFLIRDYCSCMSSNQTFCWQVLRQKHKDLETSPVIETSFKVVWDKTLCLTKLARAQLPHWAVRQTISFELMGPPRQTPVMSFLLACVRYDLKLKWVILAPS